MSLISIHAPVKGATLQPAKAIYAWHNFNPRTREGCDLTAEFKCKVYADISIHAPVKGATCILATRCL